MLSAATRSPVVPANVSASGVPVAFYGRRQTEQKRELVAQRAARGAKSSRCRGAKSDPLPHISFASTSKGSTTKKLKPTAQPAELQDSQWLDLLETVGKVAHRLRAHRQQPTPRPQAWRNELAAWLVGGMVGQGSKVPSASELLAKCYVYDKSRHARARLAERLERSLPVSFVLATVFDVLLDAKVRNVGSTLAKRLQDAIEAASKGREPGSTLTRARQRWSLGQYVNQMREILKEPSQAEPATKAEPVPVAVGPASRASDDLLQREIGRAHV
mgnify:CR=1 FL=1